MTALCKPETGTVKGAKRRCRLTEGKPAKKIKMEARIKGDHPFRIVQNE
jgi:hypothetical protein